MSMIPDLELLVNLRKELHRSPELSGQEVNTPEIILRFLKSTKPDEVIRGIGGNGLLVRYSGESGGPRVMVRAELDALPINEINRFSHRSANPGVAHMCGHDGHMAIAAGVATEFSRKRPERGEVAVVFQPSEENGRGASEITSDPRFDMVRPDYIVALHNLPGFQDSEVVLRDGVFSMASVGMIVELTGKTSHAAEPEKGISPARAVSKILTGLPEIAADRNEFRQFALATIIHTRIGDVAFGTSPGHAVVMATLRAFDNVEMEKLSASAERLVTDIAVREGLGLSVSWTERFPATVNDTEINRVIENNAVEKGLRVRRIEEAFRWSEDFGWFTRKYRGVLFGLGAGAGHPELHNPDYDFPDKIIAPGISLLTAVCRDLVKK
jgi:amidohydrolase